MKGTVSAQKVLKGYNTDLRELLVGTEENGAFSKGVIDLHALKANQNCI